MQTLFPPFFSRPEGDCDIAIYRDIYRARRNESINQSINQFRMCNVCGPPCRTAGAAAGVYRRRSRDGTVVRASVRSKSAGARSDGRDFLLASGTTRRELILGMGLSLPMLLDREWASADPAGVPPSAMSKTGAIPSSRTVDALRHDGPFQALRLPRLKHIYTSCRTSADRCTLKISAWVPNGGSSLGLKAPFPLVVITSGFLIGSDQYNSYAERLASWGYAVVSYDFTQQVLDPTTDIESLAMLEELIDWCTTSGNVLSKVSDPENVMLIGHSRGAKISTLAAIKDRRIKSLFLLDPVDITVYTPDDRINYPSATVALSASPATQQLPVCIVGGGGGGDCAPVGSNYDLFYRAARGPTWKAVVEEAGHLQFLDQRGATAMGAFCQAGTSTDDDIKDVARLMMVAWAETSMRRRDGVRIGVDANGWAVRAGPDEGERTDIEDTIDSVFEAVKKSPIPVIFEYKNMKLL